MAKTLKTMSESTVFNYLNHNNHVNNLISNILTKGTMLTPKDLERAFVTIKMYKYPLKAKVLEYVENGRIRMVFAPKDARMTPAMPFFLQKAASGETRAVVLVDIYGSMDRDGLITIDAKKLYVLLESALLAISYAREHASMSTKAGVVTNGSMIYANMFARTLNRKYALNADKVKLHKVQFLASKFFLINILGRENDETTTNYAMRNTVGGNVLILKDIDTLVKDEDYKDLASFIQALKKPELYLNFGESLTTRSFIEQFIMMYDQSALLALELYPYFMLTVNAVNTGAYINNQLILEDIVEKNGLKLYQEMLTLTRA